MSYTIEILNISVSCTANGNSGYVRPEKLPWKAEASSANTVGF